MLSPVLLIALLGLAGGVGWGAGRLLHRRQVGVLVPDVLQGVCGAALGIEVYTLTGPLLDGVAEVVVVAVIGAWVAVGAAHLAAVVLRRLGVGRGPRDV